jgi:hypothetical protein
MELRYPVFDYTESVVFANPELQDGEQLLLDVSFKQTADGGIKTYRDYPHTTRCTYSFLNLDVTEKEAINSFLLGHIGEWVRLVDHNNKHRKVKVLNELLEQSTGDTELYVWSLVVQLDQYFEGFNHASVNILVESETNEPDLDQTQEVSFHPKSKTSDARLNRDTQVEIYPVTSTSDDVFLTITTSINIDPESETNTIYLRTSSEVTFDVKTTTDDFVKLYPLTEYIEVLDRFIVSKLGIVDHYDTIQTALDDAKLLGIPNIYIRNGTYAEEVELPDMEWNIIGESMDDVIIRPTTSDPAILLNTGNYNVSVSNLTLDGVNHPDDATSYLVDGTYAIGTRTTTINFELIKFVGEQVNKHKTRGFYPRNKLKRMNFFNCIFNDLDYGVYDYYGMTGGVLVRECDFVNVNAGVYLYSYTPYSKVILNNFLNCGNAVRGRSGIKFVNNTYEVNSSTTLSAVGTYVGGQSTILGNTFIIDAPASLPAIAIQIAVLSFPQGVSDIVVQSNIIDIAANDDGGQPGIFGIFAVSPFSGSRYLGTGLKILDNTIRVDVSDANDQAAGIRLYNPTPSDFVWKLTEVKNNTVDMVNARTNDFGIIVDEYAEDTIIQGGSINNAGTPVLNNGIQTNQSDVGESGVNTMSSDGALSRLILGA